MRIQHNMPALNASNQYGKNNKMVSKALEALSSGLRITKAADDAAGLGISEKMRAQITGLNQASDNSRNGISLIQTAEGAMNETHNSLQRMNELALMSMNGTLTDSERTELNNEFQQLVDEIDRIAKSTNFNKIQLLDGSQAKKIVSKTLALSEATNVQTRNFIEQSPPSSGSKLQRFCHFANRCPNDYQRRNRLYYFCGWCL